MTHSFADIKLKDVYDPALDERLWIFFRNSITEPLLIVPDFTMREIAKIVTAESLSSEKES